MQNVESTVTEEADETRRQIEALGPWFHNLHLPGGVQTLPNHFLGGDFPAFKWREIEDTLPADLSGWRVLDVGCNAGFYSFELAQRGASVLGIDVEPLYLAQARWARGRLGLEERVEFRQMEVYEIADAERDLRPGLVHGRLLSPALSAARARPAGRAHRPAHDVPDPDHARRRGPSRHARLPDPTTARALLEPGWPKMAFLEHRLAGDETNWWAANHAAAEAMLRSAGLRIVDRPGHEIYLCEPDPQAAERRAMYASQLAAVTGRVGWHPPHLRARAGATSPASSIATSSRCLGGASRRGRRPAAGEDRRRDQRVRRQHELRLPAPRRVRRAGSS